MKKHLTCSPKERNRFLHRTEQMLDAFLEENPDATEEDLYLALGSPEKLAEQMMELYETKPVNHSFAHYIAKFAATSIILCATLIFTCIVVHQYLIITRQIEVNPTKYIYVVDNPKSIDKEG